MKTKNLFSLLLFVCAFCLTGCITMTIGSNQIDEMSLRGNWHSADVSGATNQVESTIGGGVEAAASYGGDATQTPAATWSE